MEDPFLCAPKQKTSVIHHTGKTTLTCSSPRDYPVCSQLQSQILKRYNHRSFFFLPFIFPKPTVSSCLLVWPPFSSSQASLPPLALAYQIFLTPSSCAQLRTTPFSNPSWSITPPSYLGIILKWAPIMSRGTSSSRTVDVFFSSRGYTEKNSAT